MRVALLALSWVLPFALSAQTIPPVTPGFPNVQQVPGTLLSGLNAPNQGRTSIITYHNGVLMTVPESPGSLNGSDLQVRSWDLSDPTQPVELDTLGVTANPINAHGLYKLGEYLIVGTNNPQAGDLLWSFRAGPSNTLLREAYPDDPNANLCFGVRGCLFFPWLIQQTYWSYGEISGLSEIFLRNNGGGVPLATFDHLGMTGVVGHPFMLGNLLIYAADQSRTGVATYDISDISNPQLLDVLTIGGPGGYWPELWGSGDRLYVVFPYRTGENGFRVVDVTDPTDLIFVADRVLPGDEAMYAQFQDEFAFIGDHKIDMRSYESVLFLDSANAIRTNDGGVGISTSQFALPLGNLLVTGGVNDNQGMAIWAHQAEPDLRGPYVAYHIPRPGAVNYPIDLPISLIIHETLETYTLINGVTFIVRPVGDTNFLSGTLIFAFDDILTFTPDSPLAADTTYEVIMPAGGVKDAAGNGMEPFSFTFSTGAAVNGNLPPVISSLVVSDYPAAPGQEVSFTTSATDPEGQALEYRFDFGDGSPATAWQGSPVALYTYAQPGHWRSSVQVRDIQSALASRGTVVTVLDLLATSFETNSQPLVCDAAANQVWTVNPDNDSLSRLDTNAMTLVSEIGVCSDPRSLTRVGNELWLSCYDDDLIEVHSANDGSLITTIDTGYGSGPQGLVSSPDGQQVYVALQNRGQLRRYSVATRSQDGVIDLGPKPRALALSSDGQRLLVTRFISPLNYAQVWEVNATTMSLTRTFRIGKFGGDSNRDGTASGRGTANYLTAIVIAPDGTRAWVTANKPNTERGLLIGPDLDEDNTVRNLILELDLVNNVFVDAIDIDNSDSSSGLAFSPLGDYLFVSQQGNDEVLVLDALELSQSTGLGSFVTRIAVGAAPQGLCMDAITQQLWVKNFLDRNLTGLDISNFLQTGNIQIPTANLDTVLSENLSPEILSGKRIFYNASDPRMSPEGYLSCATCHLDGGSDARIWDFTGRGEGLRNTTSLRGRAGVSQGRVHWTGNFDEIQDFENDIRNGFGGSGFMSDIDFAATSNTLGPPKAGLSAELDALAAYVTSLDQETHPGSPYRNADGSLTAEAELGRSVFATLGCASCHSGTDLTDSASGVLHDVGTLRTTSGSRLGGPLTGIDTPTLYAAWNNAPYFHDGTAGTLADVFVNAGGVVIAAETGQVAGGAQIIINGVFVNNDDTVRGRALVSMNNQNANMTLSNVDGGSGGIGAIEFRHASGASTYQLNIAVNGVNTVVSLPPTGNDPSYRLSYWQLARAEGIDFNPGATNTIVLTAIDNFPNIGIDEVLISTADDLLLAQPHRQLLQRSSQEQQALLAFLNQLDRQQETPDILYSDSFE